MIVNSILYIISNVNIVVTKAINVSCIKNYVKNGHSSKELCEGKDSGGINLSEVSER